jgi:hypothetical protein
MSDQRPGALVGLVKSCAEPAKLRLAGKDRCGASPPKPAHHL